MAIAQATARKETENRDDLFFLKMKQINTNDKQAKSPYATAALKIDNTRT